MAATARFLALLACLLGLASFVCASTVTPLNITALPGCATTCILQEMGRSDCGFANQTCLCANEAYNDLVTTCVIANCTIKQQLVTKNQTLAACGKLSVDQTDTTLKVLRVTLFILPTFFIGVRLTGKLMKLSTWGWDDITILAAYVILVGFMPANFAITQAGAGRDMWTLTPTQISQVLLIIYIFNLLYFTCLSLIKASLILMYLRIFPDQKIRKILWATLALNIALWTGYLGPAIFVCSPISFFWDGWMQESEGQCINYHATSISYAVFQLLLDVILLVTPATQIWGLNMGLKKKIGVYLIFGAGIFLTAVGAYRIRTLADFATSTNPTVNTYESAVWSNVELCTGVFVACLPSTQQLWKRMVPKVANLTNAGSKAAASKASNHGSNSWGTGGYIKRHPAENKSWMTRMVEETNNDIPLREHRSVSAVSLVESPDRPDRSLHSSEV
ncbi:CFEM domain-containing protein [Colletotrichum graminicola]|uniref:CFEM domain-containing protein n=1 Tax=Colletotrichum graminicola (strain M1.001 / M2 / FGSC 10212) TaxID=645133 RepID=E3QFJ8_COLGM|nr:CFEM domain-containing protein [Colletotrichum graminicola M1.001]EFQ29636.1 CFEM domain-containing protein [Colletotrichum graminicola M1.001]WDK23632.1 CFEM domain-containing protein [Colletotrichum graminicola]